MDYAKKSVKFGKALYTAVDGAIRNPDQFLAHGQHPQQYPVPQQPYYQQQIPQQYNPQQPPPYPPRPGAQPTASPVYSNGPNQNVQYQPQTTGYTHAPQFASGPQTVEPHPPAAQSMQYQPANQQFTGQIPATAPYTPHPTSPQPAWHPTQQPPQPMFSPVQSSQPYSPPSTGAFSPPPPDSFPPPQSHMSPIPPVSPMTTTATPVSYPFSPPLSTSTPAVPSPPLGINASPFQPNNGQFQGHSTPPPLSHTPSFGSHSGQATNSYHAPLANPTSAPVSPPPSQSPHIPNPYNPPGSGSQQPAFMAELPADNFANQPVEMLAELPADLLPSKPAEHTKSTMGRAQASSAQEHAANAPLETSTGHSAAGFQPPSTAGQMGISSNQPDLVGGETLIIPPSTVTPSEQIQQPKPVHPQNGVVAVPHTTPTHWQVPAPAPAAAYNPSIYQAMPAPNHSPQLHSAPFPQAQPGTITPGYVAFSQSQQPVPYQQPNTETGASNYIAYGQQQQQQPLVSPIAYGSPSPAPYGQPAPLERMGSLAQKAQQLSLNSLSNGSSAQFPYRAPGTEEPNLTQGPVQQHSFGPPTGHAQQYQSQQIPSNVNAPGYHPHGPPPPYIPS